MTQKTTEAVQMSETAKRYYPNNWNYNAARILDELERLILSEGGQLVSTWKTQLKEPLWIENRALSEAVRKQKAFTEALEKRNSPAAYANREELQRLESIDNRPIPSRYAEWCYICFTLGGYYYNFSPDRNPFFPFYFSKIPVIDGRIDPDSYAIEDKKEWVKDCFFGISATDDDRKAAAVEILKMLKASRANIRYRGNRRPQKLYFL